MYYYGNQFLKNFNISWYFFVQNDYRALPEPASFFEKKLGKKL